MKAKIYIGILAAVTLAVLPAKAQVSGYGNFRNEGASIVVNNYYNDYDYYFSSRINRFHRDYSSFGYYSPVYTDTYWYNLQPYSWGVSIYGGGGMGFGIYNSYPVYNYGWYDPYYGYNYGWGYDPFYSNWYSPVFISVRYRNSWAFNDRGWYGHNYWYRDYRPVYNIYNYYNYSEPRSSDREYSNRSGQAENNRTNGTVSRRSETIIPGSGRDVNNSGSENYGRQTGSQNRRSTDAGTGRNTVNRSSNYDNNTNNTGNTGNSGNNGNNGSNGNNANNNSNNGNNRNSVENGNNGNFGNNNRNTGNNGNNNNSQPGGNNGNFGNKSNISAPASTERRVSGSTGNNSQGSVRNISAPSGRSSTSSPASSTPSRTTTSSSKSSSSGSSTRSSSSSSSNSSSNESGSRSSSGSTGRRR